MTAHIQVITATETRDAALEIAKSVVKRRLAACAQAIGPICSTYWWKGDLETTTEWACVMKTRQSLYEELEQAIREVHPYEVPEILAVPVVAGSRDYLEWLSSELK